MNHEALCTETGYDYGTICLQCMGYYSSCQNTLNLFQAHTWAYHGPVYGAKFYPNYIFYLPLNIGSSFCTICAQFDGSTRRNHVCKQSTTLRVHSHLRFIRCELLHKIFSPCKIGPNCKWRYAHLVQYNPFLENISRIINLKCE